MPQDQHTGATLADPAIPPVPPSTPSSLPSRRSVNTKVRATLWKKEDPEDSHADMVAAQAAAEEARFEVARKLTELEGRKRHEFLEALALTMDAHVKFFARGHEVGGSHGTAGECNSPCRVGWPGAAWGEQMPACRWGLAYLPGWE